MTRPDHSPTWPTHKAKARKRRRPRPQPDATTDRTLFTTDRALFATDRTRGDQP